MCNNVLQYAHVYAFAREHGMKSISMRFAYKYQYFNICKMRGHNFFYYLMAKTACKLGWIPTISYDTPGETSVAKEHAILNSRSVVVQGWEVRHYDLFLKHFDEIRSLFEFLPEVRQSVASLVAEGDGSIRLGVHVRRGDYSRWNGGRYFFSDEQYARVAASFVSLHQDKRLTIYICGNDPKLDREIYRKALPDVNLVFPTGNPGEDLCVLSECDYLIGAPSTFSLVASMYRNLPLYWIEDPGKPVVNSDFSRFDKLFREIK